MLTSSAVDPVGTALLATFRQSFRTYKALSDRALAQLLHSVAIRGEVFQSLSIPRGQSEQFNQIMTGTR